MKRIQFIQILCTTFVVFFTTSCEHEAESLQPTLEQTNSGEFAVFTFANGNKLQLIESDEEGDPVIIAIESGSEYNKIFIDFDTHSMLDVYLALTSEKTPVPKVLLDISKSSKNKIVLEKRSVINSFSSILNISLEEVPENLLQKESMNRDFCNVKADYCSENNRSKNKWWDNTNTKFHKADNFTYLPTKNSSGTRMLVKVYYRNAFGNWKENTKGKHYVERNIAKRITYQGVKRRYRAVRRKLDRGENIVWDGWTDFKN